ncbi:chaperone J-domain-containing protein [Thelephora ganbajun]|uniref:Chaperone J-domain-containing protein n=1 Tax=Thelephora ganbajun TaxID=370292 RepID=A0ACB6ZS92_THEGA|nr:chaperone J-domain-containing protein [Thelephora ganbajun]
MIGALKALYQRHRHHTQAEITAAVMKPHFLFFWLTLLAVCVLAWEKEDYEIFDLVSAVEKAEGKGTTFYSWLDVPSTATTAEVSKAYRKKSIQLHPDKNPGVVGIHERFARLGVIASILRNAGSRKRYDFFYKNGVPKWRGTGYYYSRFRPGVGTVFMFLVLLTTGLQYMVQRLNYAKDLERIERIRQDAKTTAWGNRLVPPEGQKKVRVNLGGGIRFDEEGNAIPGKMIDMVVEGESVYIAEDGELILLDGSSAIRAALKNTWFIGLFRRLGGNFLKREKSGENETDNPSPEDSGSETGGYDSSSSRKARRMAAGRAGGMRRKAVKNRKPVKAVS